MTWSSATDIDQWPIDPVPLPPQSDESHPIRVVCHANVNATPPICPYFLTDSLEENPKGLQAIYSQSFPSLQRLLLGFYNLVLLFIKMSQQRLKPISEEITPTDHYILCCGGTTSNLERLPSRLQRSKRLSPDLETQMEEYAYEMSYLKAELHWHKETKQILLQLQQKMLEIFRAMEDALSQTTARLHESERCYLSLWDSGSGDEAESLI